MIQNSQILENEEHGIWAKDSAQVAIESSSVNNNDDHGLVLEDSARVTIHNSKIFENQGAGFAVKGSVRISLQSTEILSNKGDGFKLEGGENTLTGSTIKGNGDSGIELWNGSLTIRGGEISDNGAWGIFNFRGDLDHSGVRFQGNKLGPLSPGAQTPKPLYLDPAQPIEVKVEDLLSRMTLEEKVAQLDILDGEMLRQEGLHLLSEPGAGSVLPRLFVFWDPKYAAEFMNLLQQYTIEHTYLGIPVLIGTDCPLGASVRGGTIFPSSLGMASTWDPEFIQMVGSIIAKESRALGVHQTYSPVLDISRDPRWGRVEETLGEDPYLAAVMGTAMVNGLQGESLNTDHTIIATPKHFAGYGRVIGGRNGTFESVSERELREAYLPPFEAAVKADARSIMAAYSELNGVPAVASEWLLTKILREEWGFTGFVTTDWEDIEDLYRVFGVAATFGDAIEQALQAGADLHMLTHTGSPGNFQSELVELVRSGKLSEGVVNEAVRRILTVKFELGLFEHPFADPERAAEIVGSEEHRKVALQVARKSIILLDNPLSMLPLSKEIESIAFVDLNDSIGSMLGWGYDWVYEGMTVLKGIQEKVLPETIHEISEWELERSLRDPERYPEPLKTIKEADVAIVVAGEPGYWTGETWPGHERDRASLELPEGQRELIEGVYKTRRFAPTVVVFLSGRPLAIEWMKGDVAILWAGKPGPEGGKAIADILFGDYNPGGKLPISFPYTVGQIPIFYNYHPYTRKTHYIGPYTPDEPLFPFGHGLSYTKFEYSNLRITPEKVALDGEVKISVDVQNVGDREGDEIVQLYIKDVVSSVVRPVKELKGFRRITLKPDEKKTVEFTLIKPVM